MTITVAELIKRLEQFPPDTFVRVSDKTADELEALPFYGRITKPMGEVINANNDKLDGSLREIIITGAV